VLQPTVEISDVDRRLKIFGITSETRRLLAETWPVIGPHMPAAIDAYFERCEAMTWVAEKLLPHREVVKDYYLRHFAVVFQGLFDERYVETFRRKRTLEETIGFHDQRPHMSFGHYALRSAIGAVTRRFRFSAMAAGQRITALSQALAFDNATTLALIIDTLTRSGEARRQGLESAIARFDTTASEVLAAVKQTSVSLIAASGAMRSVTESTERCMGEVAQASLRTTENVASMASATQAIGNSIDQIRDRAILGSQKATVAANDARRANDSIETLAVAVRQIGSVTGIISQIASQTNLLALNAAIEAARAGVAGRGFAIVSSEVKDLANQTSRATDEIVQQIGEIQALTEHTVGEINSVVERIVELTQASAEIASAVDEQSRATQEIGQGMQLAEEHAQAVSGAISTAEQVVSQGVAAAADVLKWSEALSGHADGLGEKVKDFFHSVRTQG
jgi:methyl-accepting chemotaxis protein